MLHQTQASLWVCTGCESTHGTPWQGRKIPVPACSSWGCFWAKLHGNSRLQLASILQCALTSAVTPSLKPVQVHLESRPLLPAVCGPADRQRSCLAQDLQLLPQEPPGSAAPPPSQDKGALLVCMDLPVLAKEPWQSPASTVAQGQEAAEKTPAFSAAVSPSMSSNSKPL